VLCLLPIGAKPSLLGRWWSVLGWLSWSNKSVKGTGRPLAVMSFRGSSIFRASFVFTYRPAPYQHVRLSEVKVSGFGLPSSASVVADSFFGVLRAYVAHL
jgi:hypothetical protein